jgi:TPR repeat protein
LRHAKDEDGRRRAVAQLRLVTAAELPTAIYLVGVLTEHGGGVARDPKLAVEQS